MVSAKCSRCHGSGVFEMESVRVLDKDQEYIQTLQEARNYWMDRGLKAERGLRAAQSEIKRVENELRELRECKSL